MKSKLFNLAILVAGTLLLGWVLSFVLEHPEDTANITTTVFLSDEREVVYVDGGTTINVLSVKGYDTPAFSLMSEQEFTQHFGFSPDCTPGRDTEHEAEHLVAEK